MRRVNYSLEVNKEWRMGSFEVKRKLFGQRLNTHTSLKTCTGTYTYKNEAKQNTKAGSRVL